MICPYCNYDNLPGIDTCDQCLMDLQQLDRPSSDSPIEDSLIREPVRCLGPKMAVSVSPETTVSEVVEILVEKNIGCVLVEADGRVVGIFSERDLLLKVSAVLDDVADRPVSDFMTERPETLDESTPLAFALNKMSVGDFRHLPLTHDGHPSGIVSLRDFLAFVFRWYPEMSSSET